VIADHRKLDGKGELTAYRAGQPRSHRPDGERLYTTSEK
jgi:hypothetical protein